MTKTHKKKQKKTKNHLFFVVRVAEEAHVTDIELHRLA